MILAAPIETKPYKGLVVRTWQVRCACCNCCVAVETHNRKKLTNKTIQNGLWSGRWQTQVHFVCGKCQRILMLSRAGPRDLDDGLQELSADEQRYVYDLRRVIALAHLFRKQLKRFIDDEKERENAERSRREWQPRIGGHQRRTRRIAS